MMINILSKTSEVDLTLKEKALMSYWDEFCLETSQRLLSHTETGDVGSDLNTLNSLQINTIATSWFSTTVNCHHKQNLSTICSQLSTSVDCTDSESTVVRSRKIRIYPRNKHLARKYLGLSRWWYNRIINYLNQPNTKASLYDVRKVVQKGDDIPEWAFECPQRIREHAMSDACNAVKNAKVKCQKTGQFQNVSFRAKRDPMQSFGFDANSVNEYFVFSRKNFQLDFHSTESFKSDLEGTWIVREGSRYFLIMPQRISARMSENQRLGAVSLDPGVRTFVTFYSEVLHGKIGEGDFKQIALLCSTLDKLYSKISQAHCRQKRNLRKAAERIRWKIYDLIDDLHKKTAHFLYKTFHTVFIPTFETQQMVSKLKSSVARNMMTFAHYRFKQFLIAKGQEYQCDVQEVSEAYTTKTCSYCGKQHKMGSKKVNNRVEAGL